jgi:hypothetical protein
VILLKLPFGTNTFILTCVCVEYETGISSWHIWIDNHTEMIVLPLFQFATRLIHRTHIKLRFIMNSNTLICIWILVFTIDIFEVSTRRKCVLWLYFIWIYFYWTPNNRKSLVHISWNEMEGCEKRASKPPQNAKNNLQMKNKIHVHN